VGADPRISEPEFLGQFATKRIVASSLITFGSIDGCAFQSKPSSVL